MEDYEYIDYDTLDSLSHALYEAAIRARETELLGLDPEIVERHIATTRNTLNDMLKAIYKQAYLEAEKDIMNKPFCKKCHHHHDKSEACT